MSPFDVGVPGVFSEDREITGQDAFILMIKFSLYSEVGPEGRVHAVLSFLLSLFGEHERCS